MNKNLIICLCFVLINCVVGINSSNSTSSAGLQGSRSGTVTLYKNYYKGFYVGTDFKYDYSNANDHFGAYTYSMYLGLYTSQTLLSNNCLSFNTYYCYQWDCVAYPTKYTVNYPYFSAYGSLASTDAYVEYNKWSLYTQALYADSCTTNSAKYGYSSYGILGMGINGNNKYNFKGDGIFSIYLNKDLSGGQLLFRQDLAYATSNYPVAQFYTDGNWKASLNYYSSVQVGTYSTNINANLIFDVNADAIGFPEAIYNSILLYLRGYSGVDCVGASPYQPTCTYYGYISSLPSIYINNGTTNSIPIPPEVYVQNASNLNYVTQITLNLKALGTNYTGYNYVTAEFSDYIIFDANFMKYYYTVFDASSSYYGPRIRIYTAGNPPASGPAGYFIAGAVVALIVVCSICNCIKRGNKRATTTVVTTTAAVVQPPLIINQDQTQVYMPPSVQYAQQPYAYVQPQQPQGAYPQQQGFVQPNYGYQQ